MPQMSVQGNRGAGDACVKPSAFGRLHPHRLNTADLVHLQHACLSSDQYLKRIASGVLGSPLLAVYSILTDAFS